MNSFVAVAVVPNICQPFNSSVSCDSNTIVNIVVSTEPTQELAFTANIRVQAPLS